MCHGDQTKDRAGGYDIGLHNNYLAVQGYAATAWLPANNDSIYRAG
jgi:hypothetical protein